MKKKLISVIIPTYNRADLIEETINSVLNQTYQNFEILIIDDGSTDNTKAVVGSFKNNRIRYIWQKHGGFPGLTRNNGIKVARGEYVAFLDSDDLWLPQKLDKQIDAFEKNPNILLVSTNGIKFPSNYVQKFFSIQDNKIMFFRELLKKNLVITSSILMKRSVIKNIGLMDESLRNMQDYDYWLKILKYKDKSILILRNILIKYRIHESNITEQNLNKYPKYLLKRYKIYLYIYSKFHDYDQNYIKSILRDRLYHVKLSQMEQSILQKRISQYNLIKDKHLKFNDKLSLLIKYYYNSYFNFIKNNFLKEFISLSIKLLKI